MTAHPRSFIGFEVNGGTAENRPVLVPGLAFGDISDISHHRRSRGVAAGARSRHQEFAQDVRIDGNGIGHTINLRNHGIGWNHVKVLSDGWTAVTRDRSLTAQYEHSVGVTADGCEMFTLSPAGLFAPGLSVGQE